MDPFQLEGIAEAILHEGGLPDDEVPRLGDLVRSLLGVGSVAYSPVRLPGDGALVRILGRWRIFVKQGLPVERRAFAIAHELAEWWLHVRERYDAADVEYSANYVGAAILVPRRALRRSLSVHGVDFPELAADFRTTESHVALRHAEVDRIPRALVTPALVRVRGPEEWQWPSEQVLRGWARQQGIPGIRKTLLTDDPRRVVLDFDEAV